MFENVDYRSNQVGLADCNNFYCSCERAFRPEYRTAPVGVLSNNDGCIIARSQEIKDIGIEMGVPYFKVKKLIRKYGVVLFSSNYELYGDMSNRVMASLATYVPETEVYSIDECFLDYSGMQRFNLKEYGEKMVKEVSWGTGIPLSLGIAPTKTLAKLANKFAKRHSGYKGACVIDSPEKHIKALQLTKVGDIWGVGKEYKEKLNNYGIKTAYDLATAPRLWVRKKLTVVGERMWHELRGFPCYNLDNQPQPKKSITTSRAFGKMATNIEDIKEAIATFSSLCAQKLRMQNSCTSTIQVFIHTNNFNPKSPQYAQNIIVKLPVPTNVTNEIIHYSVLGVEKIFKEGYEFKKGGVTIMETSPAEEVQQNVYDTSGPYREKLKKIMPILDKYNSGFNKNLLITANQLGKHNWKMKQEHRSPCYTTRISDLPRIKLY